MVFNSPERGGVKNEEIFAIESKPKHSRLSNTYRRKCTAVLSFSFFTGYVTEFVNVNVLTWLNEIVFLVEKELHDILHGEFPYAKIGLGGKGLQIYNLNSIFRHFDFRNH